MEIVRSDEGNYVLVTLLGRLDELAAGEVERAFTGMIDAGVDRVLLDLSGVEYISSSGLRVLLMLLRAVKQREGRLVLCGLSPFVAEVFDISNFRSLFEVRQDSAEARAAFAATGP